MNSDDINFERILDILRRSKPAFHSADEIEEKVMERIFSMEERKEPKPGIIDFLFGWVYIGWVRKSLITASLILVVVFVYQQAVILKRINNLNKQAIFIESHKAAGDYYNQDAAFLYRLAGRKLSAGDINIYEKQIRGMLRSYSELEEKYRDLLELIESNPELKKYIEKQLGENNKVKFNL